MEKSLKTYLLVVCFFSGLTIMVFEVAASRLLAPYFGTSLFVWSNIIGVVLLSLALGYYWGGRLADRRPEYQLLLKLIIAACSFFCLAPWIIKPLAGYVTFNSYFITSGAVVIFAGSLLIALLLFSAPLILLGMVSPFIIKIFSLSDSNIGRIAGLVSSVSTVGSLAGTFLPALILIPWLGTRLTIISSAAILLLIALWGLRKNKRLTAAWLILILPMPFISLMNNQPNPKLIFETESIYQYIRVFEEDSGLRWLAFNEASGLQSMYYPHDVMTGGYYYDYYSLLPELVNKPAPQPALIIGLAGGTISRQLNYFYGNRVQTTGVEIDPQVINAGRKFFDLDNENLRIVNQDGRVFLQQNQERFDIIIIDAYSQQLYIPWTLTTVEFWQQVNQHLNPDSVVAINVNAAAADSKLLKVIANTMAEVFGHTYLAPIDNDNSWNYIILAGQSELDFAGLGARINNSRLKPLAQNLAAQVMTVEFDPQQMVLTDDRAPIIMLTDKMIYSHIFSSMHGDVQ